MTTPLDALLASLQEQPDRPPIHRWQPEFSGDMDMLIKADGSWWHEGRPINKPSLVKLFASILRCESDGFHYLVTPVEKWRVQVEDKPLLIVAMDVAGQGTEQTIVCTTNVDTRYLLSEAFPLAYDKSVEGPKPFLCLDNGLCARVGRNVYYELVELVVEEAGQFFLVSDGCRFELM